MPWTIGKWLITTMLLGNLALFFYASYQLYQRVINLRTYHGFKALFYFLLMLGLAFIKGEPEPPPILGLALLICFLKDLYVYMQPFKQEQ